MQVNELTVGLGQTADELTRTTTADEATAHNARTAAVRVEYRPLDSNARLPEGLLAIVHFGHPASAWRESSTTLCIDVGLESLTQPAQAELWWAQGQVEAGLLGIVRYARDDRHLFAVIDIDEREQGIRDTAQTAYAEMRRFQQQTSFPHLLRMWNCLDAINEGAGDLERYRQFCVGRMRGLGDLDINKYPAATAIGRQHSTHRLQVYWLASRMPGTSIENPRQVSAYRYPRTHGPASPSFARATIASDGTLLISGTASIVGHVSQHGGDTVAQLDETLRNLSTLLVGADDALSAAAQANILFKVYVRDPAHLEAIALRLRHAFPRSSAVFLAADVCRRELLLEIEAISWRRDP